MIDIPKRRLIDRIAGSPTFIGTGTEFVGDMACNGDLSVAGVATGECRIKGAFLLAEKARWTGPVTAGSAVIAGELKGNLTLEGKLEIHKAARIEGSIRAQTIAIERGAVVVGEMTITSGQAVTTFEEKRK
jgi:cytoskeletal protein CcmA (bactofilin family)